MLIFLCTGTLGASLLLGDYGFGVSVGILMYLSAHSLFFCMSAFLVVAGSCWLQKEWNRGALHPLGFDNHMQFAFETLKDLPNRIYPSLEGIL